MKACGSEDGGRGLASSESSGDEERLGVGTVRVEDVALRRNGEFGKWNW